MEDIDNLIHQYITHRLEKYYHKSIKITSTSFGVTTIRFSYTYKRILKGKRIKKEVHTFVSIIALIAFVNSRIKH